MITRKFSKEFLVDELDLPESALEERIIDQRRWETVFEIIFEYEGKFYKTCYSAGSTEYQEHPIWEYEKEIECTEVHKVQKMIWDWAPVE